MPLFVPEISLSGIASVITTVASFTGMYYAVKSQGQKISDRFKMLEDASAKFLTYEQIEIRVNHSADSRRQAEAVLDRRISENAGAIVELKVEISAMKQDQANIAYVLSEIKDAIKEVVKDNRAGFKDLADQMSVIKQKVQ